jgi:hypothetical protein
MKRYVKTTYNGCPYITAGKVYEVEDGSTRLSVYIVTCDDGDGTYTLLSGSSNLRGRDWIECTADGTPIGDASDEGALQEVLRELLDALEAVTNLADWGLDSKSEDARADIRDARAAQAKARELLS